MQRITDVIIEPSGEKSAGTLIFFHGLGACGQEMADYVGETLKNTLPDVKMRFADAPNFSRSWFEARDMIHDQEVHGKPLDGNIAARRAHDMMPSIHAYIGRVLEEDGIEPHQLILSGFSQGGPMAFYSAFQRHEEIGGVAVISGVAIDQVRGINSRPEALIMAGANEPSHFSGRFLAEKTHHLMQEFGFRSGLYLTPDNGHNICANTLSVLSGFVRDRLNQHERHPESALNL